MQQGLVRTGVRTVQLGTEEAIELLYKMFNPGEEGKPMPLEAITNNVWHYSTTYFRRKDPTEKPQHELPVLPEEIYQTGVLDLQDVIAPHALKIDSRELDLGEKDRAHVLRHLVSALPHDGVVRADHQHGQSDRHLDLHPSDGHQRDAPQIPEESRRGAVADLDARREGDGARPDARHRLLATSSSCATPCNRRRSASSKWASTSRSTATTREEIDKIETEIRGILESRLVYIRPALFQQEQGFRSVLPLGTDELDVHTKLNSAPLSSIFPFISFDLTSDRGILYGINRHNSSLILFDQLLASKTTTP